MTMKKRPFENIMGKEQSHTFFYNVFSFQPRTNILLSANAFGFGQFKNLLFSKELMTQRKKIENFEEKEQSHNQQHLIQQCFPSNQGYRSTFSFVQSFEDKKKKRLNLVFHCVYNVFRNGKKC